MLGSAAHLKLTRRIVGYYALFCLSAVVWLALSIVYAARSVVEGRVEVESLSRLREAASALGSPAASKDAELQTLVERFATRWGLAYGALVSPEGTYVVHSTRAQVGSRRVAPVGKVTQAENIVCTHFTPVDAPPLIEYQTSIKRGAGSELTLVMATAEVDVWRPLLAAAQYGWVAFAGPLLVLVLGALALGYTVRPMARIEDQLCRAARRRAAAPNDFQPLALAHPVAIGWNYLLKSYTEGSQQSTLGERLRQSVEGYRQNKLEQILNSLVDGIAVTDESGTITFANKALAGLLGSLSFNGALCGRSIDECLSLTEAGDAARPFLDPNFRAKKVVAEIGRGGDMSRGVLRVLRLPQSSAQGEPVRCHVWSIRDVTQQKLADQMRDQFVNAATHELRTPLTNIKAYAETLANSAELNVEQQKSFCNTINDEVNRLARFVDDLLYLSRMEVGSTPLNPQVASMERLLREIVGKVRPQMEQKNLVFDVRLPAKLPELVLDKDKITVALVNLVGNAAKYTPAGGSVRFQAEVKDGTLQIEVEDTGIGISVEDLPKILEKFFRSADPRVQSETGSGLGLSLAAEIVRLHGGRLTVHSELNKGSRFTVSLPMVTEKGTCSNA